MRLLWLVLPAVASFTPNVEPHELLSLGVSQSVAVATSEWALISLPSAEVNYGDLLQIKYQRVMKETNVTRKGDFLGLYFAIDPYAYDPWNWETINPNLESGFVYFEANKAGDMEVRLIRPPNKILARLAVKVHVPCSPACYRHGKCVKGACICNAGYLLPDCASPDPSTFKLDAIDKDGTKDFQTTFPITILINKTVDISFNGRDYVGIYPSGSINGTKAVSWKLLSGNISSIQLYPIRTPGDYVVRLTRASDLRVLSESAPFTVYAYCPNQCSDHGKCVAGKCVCDRDWTTVDCSVGPGLVALNVSKSMLNKDEEVVVTFSRFNDAKYHHLKDSDWIGMFDPSDNDTSSPFAYQYAIATPASETDDRQYGSVVFIVPPVPFAFIFKYVRNDHIVLASTPVIPVYRPCAEPNCTFHGNCVAGSCVCNAGWTGPVCANGDVAFDVQFDASNILAGRPFSANFARGVGQGTDDDYIALYGAASTGNNDLLYDWQHANSSTTSDAKNSVEGRVQLTAPAAGRYIIRYVNVYNQETKFATLPFEVFRSCPNGCTGSNGVCIRGSCECTQGWLLPDCRRAVGDPLVRGPSSVVLNPKFLEKTNFSASLTRPEGWARPGDFLGLYPADEEKLGGSVTVMMVIANQLLPVQSGSINVDFSVSSLLQPGHYQLWYVSGVDYTKVAVSEKFEIVPDCGDGEFDLPNEKCVCPDGKTGARCEADTCCFDVVLTTNRGHPNDVVTVSWSRPHRNGRNTDIIGLYLENATDFQAPYAFQFADGGDSDGGSVSLTLPSAEESFAIHYVSSKGWVSQFKGPTVYVTFPCTPEDCSGHGVCIKGKCTCSSAWGGSKCDVSVPAAISITIESPAAIPMGSTFNFRWTRTADQGSSGDYIGLYRRMDNDRSPLSYVYVPVNGETYEGTLQMTAPASKGVHQLRWVSATTGKVLVTSDEFDVE